MSREDSDGLDPLMEQAESLYDQGLEEFQKDNFAAAIDSLSVCVDLLPLDELECRLGAMAIRSLCYYSVGNLEAALADTNKLLDLTPTQTSDEQFARLYYQRGMIHLALGDQSLAFSRHISGAGMRCRKSTGPRSVVSLAITKGVTSTERLPMRSLQATDLATCLMPNSTWQTSA